MATCRPLNFHFAARRHWIRPLGSLLLVAGSLASVFSLLQFGTAYIKRQNQIIENDALTTRTSIVHQTTDARLKISSVQLQHLRAAAVVVNELQMPWKNLLKILEAAPMDHVALLSIEPIGSARQLTLAAEAKDVSTMLEYLIYLQQQPELNQVILRSQHMQQQSPGTPVRFQIQAEWIQR